MELKCDNKIDFAEFFSYAGKLTVKVSLPLIVNSFENLYNRHNDPDFIDIVIDQLALFLESSIRRDYNNDMIIVSVIGFYVKTSPLRPSIQYDIEIEIKDSGVLRKTPSNDRCMIKINEIRNIIRSSIGDGDAIKKRL